MGDKLLLVNRFLLLSKLNELGGELKVLVVNLESYLLFCLELLKQDLFVVLAEVSKVGADGL